MKLLCAHPGLITLLSPPRSGLCLLWQRDSLVPWLPSGVSSWYEAIVTLCSAGELLTVAPWAARKMPGLFTLNERAVLSGSWEHGFFSFSAVGAYNVGSIKLEVDKVYIMFLVFLLGMCWRRTMSTFCWAEKYFSLSACDASKKSKNHRGWKYGLMYYQSWYHRSWEQMRRAASRWVNSPKSS